MTEWEHRLSKFGKYTFAQIYEIVEEEEEEEKTERLVGYQFTSDKECFLMYTDTSKKDELKDYAEKMRKIGYDTEILHDISVFKAFAEAKKQVLDPIFYAAATYLTRKV